MVTRPRGSAARRLSGAVSVLCALALPATATAATGHHAPAASASAHHATAHRGSPRRLRETARRVQTTERATGTITALDGWSFTIQMRGRQMAVISALTATANAVTKHDYPYVYGGGHAEAGTASVGIKGPGHNGRRIGYDCSGAVAAVLAGGGLWPAGAGVPNDAGVVHQLLAEHLIARGAGTGAQEVTLYDHPGVHIFMNIDGRFFGTSDGGSGNPLQRHGGAGWLDDGAPDAYSRQYKRYHLLPAALGHRTTYGRTLSFQTGFDGVLPPRMVAGERVRVVYRQTRQGANVPETVTVLGGGSGAGGTTGAGGSGAGGTGAGGTGAGGTGGTGAGGTGAGGTGGTGAGGTGAGGTGGTGAGGTGAGGTTGTGTGGSPGQPQASGTIVAIAADGSMFTIQSAGQSLTFSTGGNAGLIAGFNLGDSVVVGYVQADGGMTAQSVQAASNDAP